MVVVERKLQRQTKDDYEAMREQRQGSGGSINSATQYSSVICRHSQKDGDLCQECQEKRRTKEKLNDCLIF